MLLLDLTASFDSGNHQTVSPRELGGDSGCYLSIRVHNGGTDSTFHVWSSSWFNSWSSPCYNKCLFHMLGMTSLQVSECECVCKVSDVTDFSLFKGQDRNNLFGPGDESNFKLWRCSKLRNDLPPCIRNL